MPEVQGNYGSQSTAVKNVENGEMSPERVDVIRFKLYLRYVVLAYIVSASIDSGESLTLQALVRVSLSGLFIFKLF